MKFQEVKLNGADQFQEMKHLADLPARAHGQALPCSYKFDGGNLTATLDEPLYGLAAGQALVIYDGDRVVGSATIDRTDQAIGSLNGS